MSIFSTLTVGKQALLAQARAIQVSANNIANVNTPGYTRQRPVFVPVAPTLMRGGVPLGGGVQLSDVQRIADAALDAQLLTALGETIDFTSFERDDGQVSVFVGGGFLLVDTDFAAGLEVSVDQSSQPLSDPSFFNVFQSVDGALAGPITSRISGGKMGAALELRDTRIQFYRNSLDEVAFTLASRLNTQHLSGYGLEDDTQRRLFVDPTQPADPQGPDFVAVAGAAAVIDVNADIVANNRHLAAGATSLGVGLGAAVGDNTNALALAALQTNSAAFFQVGDPAAGPASGAQQTLGDFMDSLAGTLGAEVQSARRAVLQEGLVVANLEERRGSVSGVSIDEEVTNLIRYERAYQAAARVIEIADDLMEQLLSL